MFKRIFFMLSLLVFVICGQTGYAYGTNVALNDTITADGFEKSFNAVDAGDLSYVKLSKVEQTKAEEPGEISWFYCYGNENFQTANGMYSPYIILGIDKSNRIRLLSVYVNSQEDMEASWKLLMTEMRIALATLGEDKQEDGSNATFAMLDALKTGMGTYWNFKNNRRFILTRNFISAETHQGVMLSVQAEEQ